MVAFYSWQNKFLQLRRDLVCIECHPSSAVKGETETNMIQMSKNKNSNLNEWWQDRNYLKAAEFEFEPDPKLSFMSLMMCQFFWAGAVYYGMPR